MIPIKIPFFGYTQGMEIHSFGRGSQQTQSPGNHLHLLSYKMPVLLEGYE